MKAGTDRNSAGVMSPTTSSTSSNRDSTRDSLIVPQSPPSNRQIPSSPPKNSTDTPDRVNGFHQPPPSDEQPTVRERSSTEATRRPPGGATTSASIHSPSDFANHGHYYSGSLDSKPGAADTRIKPPTSRYRVTDADEVQSPANTTTATDATPTKKDSLTRSSGRRGTGGLARQGLVTGKETDNTAAEETRGVQLEDKPMDFD